MTNGHGILSIVTKARDVYFKMAKQQKKIRNIHIQSHTVSIFGGFLV